MRIDWHDKRMLLGMAALLMVAGAVLFALPFIVQSMASDAKTSAQAAMPLAEVATVATTPPGPSSIPSVVVGEPIEREQPEVTSAIVTAPPIADKVATQSASPAVDPSMDAYKGLGSWVDIYDDSAWENPSAAVADMARHGVRTLYLETGNSKSSFTIKSPAKTSEFIRSAHAKKMYVVAWYLPEMTSLTKDYKRIKAAIEYRTDDGQKFDSFALDIESGAVKKVKARNKALTTLSTKIRSLVGTSYHLGAIIPSPVGLSKKGGYWGDFPYQMCAEKYDVFVPMSYYTYHGNGANAAYKDTIDNVRILRSKPGCKDEPIHLIGGIAGRESSAAETKAFVRAVKESDIFGASFYSWPGTDAADWKALSAIKP
jgi:hypothetical protein